MPTIFHYTLIQQDNEQWRVVSGENLQYVWRCYTFPVAAVTIKYFWNNKWAWVNIILNCILLSLLNLKRVHLLDVNAAWQRNTIFFNTNITISIILIFISLAQGLWKAIGTVLVMTPILIYYILQKICLVYLIFILRYLTLS